MTSTNDDDVPEGYKVIYRKWVTNRRTGQRIYRRNGKAFRLVVRVD